MYCFSSCIMLFICLLASIVTAHVSRNGVSAAFLFSRAIHPTQWDASSEDILLQRVIPAALQPRDPMKRGNPMNPPKRNKQQAVDKKTKSPSPQPEPQLPKQSLPGGPSRSPTPRTQVLNSNIDLLPPSTVSSIQSSKTPQDKQEQGPNQPYGPNLVDTGIPKWGSKRKRTGADSNKPIEADTAAPLLEGRNLESVLRLEARTDKPRDRASTPAKSNILPPEPDVRPKRQSPRQSRSSIPSLPNTKPGANQIVTSGANKSPQRAGSPPSPARFLTRVVTSGVWNPKSTSHLITSSNWNSRPATDVNTSPDGNRVVTDQSLAPSVDQNRKRGRTHDEQLASPVMPGSVNPPRHGLTRSLLSDAPSSPSSMDFSPPKRPNLSTYHSEKQLVQTVKSVSKNSRQRLSTSNAGPTSGVDQPMPPPPPKTQFTLATNSAKDTSNTMTSPVNTDPKHGSNLSNLGTMLTQLSQPSMPFPAQVRVIGHPSPMSPIVPVRQAKGYGSRPDLTGGLHRATTDFTSSPLNRVNPGSKPSNQQATTLSAQQKPIRHQATASLSDQKKAAGQAMAPLSLEHRPNLYDLGGMDRNQHPLAKTTLSAGNTSPTRPSSPKAKTDAEKYAEFRKAVGEDWLASAKSPAEIFGEERWKELEAIGKGEKAAPPWGSLLDP